MHDTLRYFAKDPVHRRYHHQDLTFRAMYAATENFLLPLSHDEVVHGKGALLAKMPGDDWQQCANLRLLFATMYAQPGKKLLFMGGEFGQWREWDHDEALEWHLLQYERHQGIARCVTDLNRRYADEPALHRWDCREDGFAWINCDDAHASCIAFVRRWEAECILVACNYTPVPRMAHGVGVPAGGVWEEIFNSDAAAYGGSGMTNPDALTAEAVSADRQPYRLLLRLPPLGAVFVKRR
ncbi:MAG: alpha amylase C-terminal domain-containing protein, partial [Deltaproteobacteria bacterium]|nr:alpha amylase C-terminal domain-containing protein [Deltaproteobacteria bacterium]